MTQFTILAKVGVTFDLPEVNSVVEIPGGGVTDNVPVVWFLDHRVVPEWLRHWQEI